MNFSDRIPSSEWAVVKLLEEEIAEAWFKPDGEAQTLVFRVPRSRFEEYDFDRQLTVEDLLKAAAISIEEVDSWQFLDESHSSMEGTNPELNRLLPSPLPDSAHLTVHVLIKPLAQAAALTETGAQDVPPEKWQALDACWKAILGLEASMDVLRLSMDGLRSEMESAFKKPLAVEEKVNALQADVSQWNKGKNRVHYALPKVREFIHRAIWALAQPERKRLEEIVKSHIESRIPFTELDQIREQLEHLQKSRQLLLAQGNAVNQEGRGILADVQRTLSTLQRNAMENARRKRSAGRNKGKHL